MNPSCNRGEAPRIMSVLPPSRMRPLSFPTFLLLLAVLAAPCAGQFQDGLHITAPVLFLQKTVGGPDLGIVNVDIRTFPGNLPWEIIPNDPNIPIPPWLIFTPLSGRTNGGNVPGIDTTFISIDFSSFQPGEQRQFAVTFRVADPFFQSFDLGQLFSSDLTVIAELRLPGDRPQPLAEPLLLTFEDSSGGQGAVTQQLVVRNTGDGSFNYQFRIDYHSGPRNWLSVTPAVGAWGGTDNIHTVTGNFFGVPAGEHRATIVLTHNVSTQDPRRIPVTAFVAGPPRLQADPEAFTVKLKQNKTVPEPLEFTITNTGGGSFGYALTTDAPWLQVSPTSGEVETTPNSHFARIDASALDLGKHVAKIMTRPDSATVLNGFSEIEVEVNVELGGVLDASPLNFDLTPPTASPRKQYKVVRLSSPDNDQLEWTARVAPSTVQWLKLKTTSGRLPSNLVVEVGSRPLTRAISTSAIVVVEARPPEQPGQITQALPEDLIARIRFGQSAGHRAHLLEVGPEDLWFSFGQSGLPNQSRVISIDNLGSGEDFEDGNMGDLDWTVETKTVNGGSWLSATPGAGTNTGLVRVTANPTTLSPGIYEGSVTIHTDGDVRTTRVVASVGNSGDLVGFARNDIGLRLKSGARVSEVFRLGGRAPGTLNWSGAVSALSGGSWLTLPNSNGEAGLIGSLEVAEVDLDIDTRLTQAGRYFGRVQASSDDGGDVARIVLDVDPSTGPTIPSIDSAPLAFVADVRSGAFTRTIRVVTNSGEIERFQIGTSLRGSTNWMFANPISTTAAAGVPAEVLLAIDPTGLAPGTHRGQITVGILSGEFRTFPVSLLLTSSVGAAQGFCQASSLVVTPLSPPIGFSAPTGLPINLAARVTDNCGALVPNAGVSAVIGDDLDIVALTASAPGRYASAWTPISAQDNLNIRFFVADERLGTTEAAVVGAVVGADADVLPGGVLVSGATFLATEPLAPGAIASLFLEGLAAGEQSADDLPLPTTLNGVSIEIASVMSPLYFVGGGQANLQVPMETPANAMSYALVQAGSEYAPPIPFSVALSQPAILPLDASVAGPGRAIAINQDFSLNTPTSPAAPGEVVTVYFTGLGPVNPTVMTGGAAPAEAPFAEATLPATATVGGNIAELFFLGLTPGFVGLAQGNVGIPEDAQASGDTVFQLTVGGRSSLPMNISVGN